MLSQQFQRNNFIKLGLQSLVRLLKLNDLCYVRFSVLDRIDYISLTVLVG